MNLQQKMIELSNYNFGCRIVEGNFLINITYPTTWQIISPEDDTIEFGDRDGVTYYLSSLDDEQINKVFDFIDATIEYNKDIERKLELFKSKVEELNKIFAQEDYETLKTIEFKFKKKRQRNKTEDVDVSKNKEEEPMSERVFVEEEELTEDKPIFETVDTMQNDDTQDVVVEEHFKIVER